MIKRAVFLLMLSFGTLWPTSALERSLEIESFHADIRLQTDGSIVVRETILARFEGHWNGIYRTLPIKYEDRSLRLSLLGVTDETGRELKHESNREGGWKKIKIWVPAAEDASRTVLLSYRVDNALRFYEDHDELYWNVTGDQWAVSIDAASARITLPGGLENVRATGFEGPYGAVDKARVQIAPGMITIDSTRSLGLHEGLTVVVGWNPGAISRPGPLAEWFTTLLSAPFALLPVGAAGFMFWVWRKRGRDPRRQPIVAQYVPPEGLTPAEAGTVVDNRPDVRDITATLVDLAVRGYLHIEEKKKEKWFGLAHEDDYAFEQKKPPSGWAELKPHEREFLSALFADKQSVLMSSLENEFYKKLPKIRDRLFEQLIDSGYYVSRPDKVRSAYLVGAVAIAVLATAGFVMLSAAFDLNSAVAVGSGIGTGLIIAAFAFVMPARTLAGARTAEHVLGFEEFLDRVESDRFARVIKTPEMFEKYLPFALALGCEKRWARAFEDIYRQQPEWYHGTHPAAFQSTSLVSNLSRMTGYTATAMTSSPRSSSGSGFSSGGGFSGGGSGGGGGGGF